MPGNLLINGWAIHKERGLSNADVLLRRNDSVIQSVKTDHLGNFQFSIPFHTEIIASFSKGNLISKKVVINTLAHPKTDLGKHYFFEFEVELLDDRPSVLKDFYNFPVSVIFFDTLALDFSYYRSTIDDYLTNRRNLLPNSIGLVFDYELISHNFPNMLTVINSLPPGYKLSRNGDPASLVVSSRFADQMVSLEEGLLLKEYEDFENEWLVVSPIMPQFMNTGPAIKNFFRPEGDELSTSGVYFSIQLLATDQRVPPNFFSSYRMHNFAGNVFWYKDEDGLDKYIVGRFNDVSATMNMFRKLKSIGYTGYIVAFNGKKRIRVIEAQRLLGQKP